MLPTEGPRPPFCRQRVRWTHKQCLAVKTRFTPISICMQRIRCANGCVCLCLCLCFFLCVCVCVTAGGVRAQRGPGGSRRNVDRSPTEYVLSWRLASDVDRSPRQNSLLAARVATWTAVVIWGSLAQSVCGRVGLIVAPESGAYTVACINLLTLRVGVLHLPWTPPHVKRLLVMKRGGLEVALLFMPKF